MNRRRPPTTAIRPAVLTLQEACVKELPLTNGGVTLVDADVYEWASKVRWFAACHGKYVARTGPRTRGKNPRIYLHRLIAGEPAGFEIDHINADGLDNRRCNLRVVTRGQNSRAKVGASSRSLVGVRGVSFHGDGRRSVPYQARITIDGRSVSLGYFATPGEAGLAYEAKRAGLLVDLRPLSEASHA